MKRILSIIILISMGSLLMAQEGYTPSESNVEYRKFVKNARLGIFIHWGIYSMLGDGEWVQNNKGIPFDEYSKLAGGFYPSRFNAQEWVNVFKEAGAKYDAVLGWHLPYDSADYNTVKIHIEKLVKLIMEE